MVFNSMDFTPPEGKIVLSLSMENGNYLLSVSDTGCGIDEDTLPHIFERSFSTRKEEGGNGLGLFLVKTIAQEHQGNVSAESVPGEGVPDYSYASCFRITVFLILLNYSCHVTSKSTYAA